MFTQALKILTSTGEVAMVSVAVSKKKKKEKYNVLLMNMRQILLALAQSSFQIDKGADILTRDPRAASRNGHTFDQMPVRRRLE